MEEVKQPVDLLTKYAVRNIIGGRSTGKSTFMIGEEEKNLRGMIQTYVEEYKMRCVIIDPTYERDHPVDYRKVPVKRWQDIAKAKFSRGVIRTIAMPGDDADEAIASLCAMKDLLLVVEEAGMMIPQRMEKTMWERFAVESKNKHNCMVNMFHGYMWIPPRLLAVTNEFEIFKTTADTPQDRGIRNRDVLAAYARVMQNESQFYHETVKNG